MDSFFWQYQEHAELLYGQHEQQWRLELLLLLAEIYTDYYEWHSSVQVFDILPPNGLYGPESWHNKSIIVHFIGVILASVHGVTLVAPLARVDIPLYLLL